MQAPSRLAFCTLALRSASHHRECLGDVRTGGRMIRDSVISIGAEWSLVLQTIHISLDCQAVTCRGGGVVLSFLSLPSIMRTYHSFKKHIDVSLCLSRCQICTTLFKNVYGRSIGAKLCLIVIEVHK